MGKRITALLLCALVLAAVLSLTLRDAAPEPPASSAGSAAPSAVPAANPLPAASPAPPAATPAPTAAPSPTPDPKALLVEELLSGMTLEEKVGQMFFVRCPEENAAEKASSCHLGGYILFLRDFKDGWGWLTRESLIEKLGSYQAAGKIPLLIGVDEEGGKVIRASRNPYLFEEPFWSPQELYRAGGLDLIVENAGEKSRDLLALGINVNLAPVADVSENPGDFIYPRTFGQGGEATAEYVAAVTAEMKKAGIGSVLKHFPGYGNNVDTHTGIAIDERPKEQFLACDFLPFQRGAEAGAGGVLVSHNIVTCMDESLPASLSPEVHRVLREELGFEGVIMTDDLAMDAVAAYAGDGSAAVLAVLAGNDMVITTDFEAQLPLVIEAVKNGQIPEAMVDGAVRRVLSWKADLGLLKH